MPQEKESLHPSQVVDEDKKFLGMVIFFVALMPFVMGVLLVITGKKDMAVLGLILLIPGLIGLIIGGRKYNQSGAGDARCKSCNSNLIHLADRSEAFRGTFTRRKRIINSVTKQEEEISVVHSEFAVTDVWKCKICRNTWKNYWTREAK
ncbi:hypothetical protein CXG50_19235 [Pseudomonas plecoglossicida]|uniref:hypothetical protein n=1 Tax=Pseudomonas TaxID=286 RepID=UPI0002A15B11|nr:MULTISPECIES: hypothetical protein [Pseudomonas]AGA74848.1 hypothetical protein B479_19780 [Pseudomonas putida HB3267]MCE0756899.1 hypothetical protein [Pseudomonas asiatica]MCE1032456.1 hypothetical protein [Pseudomonas asiatica]MCE1101646.1 hypothetical protein [Pseudomonas asiatica]MCE1106978.1 hypothetical protein [Pseudomonas asiatica]